MAKATREHDGLNWGLGSKQDYLHVLHLLTFSPSLSVGHWFWAIQYPGELVQDLSDEQRNIWWILLLSFRLWYVCVVKYLTQPWWVAVQPWCIFFPSKYSVKDGFIFSQFHTCLEMVAGKSCGCQDANRGIEDLQIRLGISAQALGDGEAGKRKGCSGCRLQGGFSGTREYHCWVEAHSWSTQKKLWNLDVIQVDTCTLKKQQTSEPQNLGETSRETQSRVSAGQPVLSGFTSFPWFQWSNLRKNSPQSNHQELVGTFLEFSEL